MTNQSKIDKDLLGKLPPQATQMEEVVLGALMLERDAFMNMTELHPKDFYKDAHRFILRAIERLHTSNQ